jgi:dihydrofolate synthase / folylpolyglutamate synthase
VEQDDLFDLVSSRARERGAESVLRLGTDVHLLSRQTAVGGQLVSIGTTEDRYEEMFLPLYGEHQARNAALAVAGCEALLGQALDPEALERGLAAVRVPGRIEVVGHRPLVVVDGGHNPQAAQRVKEAVTEAFSFERLHLVVGMLSEKLIDEVLAIWAPACDQVVVCAPESERAAETGRLAEAVVTAGLPAERVSVFEAVAEAAERTISEAGPEDMVLIFGSFHTVGEARAWLRAKGMLTQS